MALIAGLSSEDRAKCARLLDLLMLTRGDELAQRALRRANDLDEMIVILERHWKARALRISGER